MNPRITLSLALGAALLGSLSAHAAQTNVGVSVSVNQPGFYGRIDIGNTQPPLIYQQPVIIEQRPVSMHQRPIYLRVPPGHERNWGKYCRQYQACGQPVYFVRPDARMEPQRGDWDDRGRHDHDDRGGRDDRGGGHGRGNGHGHGHH